MARSLFFSASVVGIFLLCCVAISATATNVTYTGQKITITQPGSYVLTNDITNSSQLICIEIQVSNVVFDGAGHLIDGNGTENSAGIFVHGPSAVVSGVTIKNVRVQDWYYGIYLYEAKSSRIEGSTLSSNAFAGAVLYKNAVGNTVTGNKISGNNYGVIFSDGSANGAVTNNQIKENDRGLYVYLSDGITVTGNTITGNINTDLQLHVSGGGKIYNNRFNNNLNVSFTTFSDGAIKANAWSVTPGATSWNPANIIGGPKVGGNYWARPDGTGFSQTNPDANGDGFCDMPYAICEGNVDALPLALYGSSPSFSGNGTFWLEQTAPAEEGTIGTATLYMNSSWELPVKEVMLNLSWDSTVMQYASTASKAGGTVLAEPSEVYGLTLRLSNLEIRRQHEKVRLADISFRGMKAGSSPLSPTVRYVHGDDDIHLWVGLSRATAVQGTFVVDAASATPTETGTPNTTPTPLSDGPGVVVPGGEDDPTDGDGDGRYEDVDGDGTATFADLVLYFNRMAWIEANEPLVCFDYNNNGRIDFADVVWLFNTFDGSPVRTFTVTAAAIGPGRITPSGEIGVPLGGNVTFTLTSESALPAPHDTQSGYLVGNLVRVDPILSPTPYPAGQYGPPGSFTRSYTLHDVRSDHTVYGCFYYYMMYA